MSQKPSPPEKAPTPTKPDEAFLELKTCIKQLKLSIDLPLVEKAFEFAHHVHRHQTRANGEPYIGHPLSVAKIIAELGLDTASVITGILHDTVEDTVATLDDIEREFGKEIAYLVDGVTKISKITFQTTEEKQAENFRKMIVAMAKDLRVILVKLADRTHNMRTLQHLPPEKQVKIAQETLDIYAPLANRLGLSALKRDLEDLSLRYTKPEIYYRLVAQVAKKRKERESHIQNIKDVIEEEVHKHGYKSVQVTGRPKHFYSIHKKMEKSNLAFEQVYDLTAFRVITNSVEECYGVLGVVHSIWTPLPGRIKDYIAIPKANFYQSLHTTVIGPQGEHIEVQIRTSDMHQTAEFGIAAHWAYKNDGQVNHGDKDRFTWLNRLLDSHKDLSDPNEFLETVKLDLFQDEVYVFTPQGEVKEFPAGSSPLDFAYSIHTDLGQHCVGARVNGKMVPLKHKLKSGDSVEIITSQNQNPNKEWLKIVQTSRAKSKIRSYLRKQEHDHSVAMGEQIFDKELKKHGLNLKKLIKGGELDAVAQHFSLRAAEDLLSSIGYGKVSSGKAITRLLPKEQMAQNQNNKKEVENKGPLQQMFDKAAQTDTSRSVVKVKGVDDLLVRFARCCNPVPGDSVIGFITRGRGISVHRRNCVKIFDSDPNRLIDIEWDIDNQPFSNSKIRVVCEDRSGLLADMSNIIRDMGVNISRAQIGTTRDQKAVCIFNLEVKDISQLRSVISKLEGIEGVINVDRVQRKA